MEKILNRHISIAKVLRTPEQTDFLDKHTLIHGIYDDYGLEGMIICKDWDTLEGLQKLNSSLNTNKLRCRYNQHRNSESFICWIPNEVIIKLNERIIKKDFITCKSLILEHSLSI